MIELSVAELELLIDAVTERVCRLETAIKQAAIVPLEWDAWLAEMYAMLGRLEHALEAAKGVKS